MQQPAAPADAASEAALAEHIRAEQLRFVFIQSPLPMMFSPAAGLLLLYAVWSDVPHDRLIAWCAGLAVIAAVRVGLIGAFPKSNPGPTLVARWERIFVTSIVLVDAWWGVGAPFLLAPHQPAQQALVFCFLMLMAGGHMASYAAHPLTVTLGVLALVLPITATFIVTGTGFHRALAVGALMYLLAVFRSIRTLSFFFGRTHRLAHEVQQERDRAEALARIDFLTSLNNRRAFFELGDAVVNVAERYDHPVTALLLDIDHFKAINDAHGHAGGDAVLRAVAGVMLHRAADVAGRLGGEEFALLLPETPVEAAATLAEKLRAGIEAMVVQHQGKTVRFTASIGLAGRARGESLEQLIARADSAMYEAKRAGRNRLVTAG